MEKPSIIIAVGGISERRVEVSLSIVEAFLGFERIEMVLLGMYLDLYS